MTVFQQPAGHHFQLEKFSLAYIYILILVLPISLDGAVNGSFWLRQSSATDKTAHDQLLEIERAWLGKTHVARSKGNLRRWPD